MTQITSFSPSCKWNRAEPRRINMWATAPSPPAPDLWSWPPPYQEWKLNRLMISCFNVLESIINWYIDLQIELACFTNTVVPREEEKHFEDDSKLTLNLSKQTPNLINVPIKLFCNFPWPMHYAVCGYPPKVEISKICKSSFCSI